MIKKDTSSCFSNVNCIKKWPIVLDQIPFHICTQYSIVLICVKRIPAKVVISEYDSLAVFTLEANNPSNTGYPSSTDNLSQCENGTMFTLDG